MCQNMFRDYPSLSNQGIQFAIRLPSQTIVYYISSSSVILVIFICYVLSFIVKYDSFEGDDIHFIFENNFYSSLLSRLINSRNALLQEPINLGRPYAYNYQSSREFKSIFRFLSLCNRPFTLWVT